MLSVDNTSSMAASPFFSGRIPQKLFDAIEDHRQRTGESKTDVLVKALSAYIDVPLEVHSQIVGEGNTKEAERLKTLETRMEIIERLIAEMQQRTTPPPALDTPEICLSDVLTDSQMSLYDIHPLEVVEEVIETPAIPDNTFDNKSDNTTESVDLTDNKADNQSDSTVDSDPSKVFIGRMKTNEIPALAGLESEIPRKIKVKLNNTRNTKSQATQIGPYLIVLSKAVEASAKRKRQELLWDVYKSQEV